MAVASLDGGRHVCCLHTCDGVQFRVRSEGMPQFAIVVYTTQCLDDAVTQNTQRIPVVQESQHLWLHSRSARKWVVSQCNIKCQLEMCSNVLRHVALLQRQQPLGVEDHCSILHGQMMLDWVQRMKGCMKQSVTPATVRHASIDTAGWYKGCLTPCPAPFCTRAT